MTSGAVSPMAREIGAAAHVHHLDAYHIVDAPKTCLTAAACLDSPSPRLRDHLHLHMPVYVALASPPRQHAHRPGPPRAAAGAAGAAQPSKTMGPNQHTV